MVGTEEKVPLRCAYVRPLIALTRFRILTSNDAVKVEHRHSLLGRSIIQRQPGNWELLEP